MNTNSTTDAMNAIFKNRFIMAPPDWRFTTRRTIDGRVVCPDAMDEMYLPKRKTAREVRHRERFVHQDVRKRRRRVPRQGDHDQVRSRLRFAECQIQDRLHPLRARRQPFVWFPPGLRGTQPIREDSLPRGRSIPEESADPGKRPDPAAGSPILPGRKRSSSRILRG